MKLTRFFVAKNLTLVVTLSLFGSLTVVAKDEIFGTPDTDADGDGDPVGNGYEFTLDETGAFSSGGSGVNRFQGDSSLANTQWWVSDQNKEGWEDYAPTTRSEDYLTAHILDPVAAGGEFWIGKTFERGMGEYTSSFRETNGILPAGTQAYFGLSSYGASAGFDRSSDIDKETNLNFINNDAPSLEFTGRYDWFHYEIDKTGDASVFTIKPDSEVVTQWIAYYILPDGESLSAGTDWVRSAFDDKGKFESVEPGKDYFDGNGNEVSDDPTQDIVFSWTVDSKNDTYGDIDPNYGIVAVPEPTSALLTLLAGVLFLGTARSRK